MANEWTQDDISFLKDYYPTHGKQATAAIMQRSEASIRAKTSKLKLRQDRQSPFFQDWQQRAAAGKIGKKRPEQAAVIKRLHDEGKLLLTPERKAAVGKWIKAWIADNGHPRGMKGKSHTDEAKQRIGQNSERHWQSMTDQDKQSRYLKSQKTRVANGTIINPHGSWKASWRTIGDHTKYFRSRWEANYARYLEWLKSLKQIVGWEHEPETFWFDGVKRGVVSYLPDFRVTCNDGSIEYHEVKGWMDARSKTKLKRMAKYHPKVKLVLIDAKAYKSLEKDVKSVVRGWE